MFRRTLVNVKRTDSLLCHGQIETCKKRSPLFCCSVKGHIFVDLLQIKDKFHCQESITYMVCPLTRERKQKKNPIFIFKSVRVRIRESVRLRECVNRKFDWEVKRGFKKPSVSRAVHLQECPLAES